MRHVLGLWAQDRRRGSLILLLRPLITEMKWRLSWEGVATGVAVFAMWVGIDGWYPKLTIGGSVWNPSTIRAGQRAAFAVVADPDCGSSLIVPLLEEVFYRSFVYRYLVEPDFQSVALGQFHWMPFLVTSALLRRRTLRVARRTPVRLRLPGPGLPEEQARRRHDRACHHKFSAWGLGRLEGAWNFW